MQIALQPIEKNSLKRTLKIEFAIPDLDKQISSELMNIARKTKMPGFRPGKVPKHIIQQQYGESARFDIINKKMQHAYREALKQESLNPAAIGEFTDMDINDPQAIKFTAVVEVLPDVKLIDFSKVSLQRKVADVSDQELQKQLQRYQKQHTQWQDSNVSAVEGCKITINFEGKIDGEAFEGNKAENFEVILGEKRMLEDFETALIGCKPGDNKTININFPEDYGTKNIQGKSACFDISVLHVYKPQLPDLEDADFLKTMQVTSLQDLKDKTQDLLLSQLQQLLDNDNKKIVFDYLVEQHPILLPETLISTEIKNLSKAHLERHNKTADQALSSEELNDIKEQAQQRVHLGLIIGQVAKTLNVVTSPVTIERQYQETAMRMFGDTQHVALLKQHENIRSEVESLALEKDLVRKIFSLAIVEEVPTRFEQLEQQAKSKHLKR